MNALVGVAAVALASAASTATPTEAISGALATIGEAALSHDTGKAAPLFADDMVMISQSGKLYARADVLADLGNGFVAWRNSDVVVRGSGNSARVTLINERQRIGMATARFRVLQLWHGVRGGWQLGAQSSVRIAE